MTLAAVFSPPKPPLRNCSRFSLGAGVAPFERIGVPVALLDKWLQPAPRPWSSVSPVVKWQRRGLGLPFR